MFTNFIMFLLQVFRLGREVFLAGWSQRIWGCFPLQIINNGLSRRLLLVEGQESDKLQEVKAALFYRGPPRYSHSVDNYVSKLWAGSG